MGLLIDGVWHEQEPAATRADTGRSDAAKNDPEAPSGVRSRMEVLAALLPETAKP